MDPQQNFMAAPSSPEQVPGVPEDQNNPTSLPGDNTELSQEQMKSNLDIAMGKVNERYDKLNNELISNDEEIKKGSTQALRDLYDLFKSYGIDPNNPEEVLSFLEEVKKLSPELYTQVQQAIQMLMGGLTEEETETPSSITNIPNENNPGIPPADNMNINPNEESSQNI